MTTVPRVDDVVSLGGALEQHRRARRLSKRRVASAIGGSTRRLTDLEEGRDVPSPDELDGLAAVFGVPVADLVPPGYRLGAVGGTSGVTPSAQSRDAELDAVLREYVTMVRELRDGNAVPAASLRHDDLRELARALGGTPDAIEARLTRLLGEADDLHELTTTLVSSSAG